jgi:hypothetical protein
MTKARAAAAALLLCAGALCAASPASAAPSPNKVTVRTASIPVDGQLGASARASAICPQRMVAISAGWQTLGPAGSALQVYESMRQGKRGWGVEARVVSPSPGGESQRLITKVACQDIRPPKGVSARVVVPMGGGVPGVRQGVAVCPRGLTALSGGFSATTVPADASLTGSFRVGGRKWQLEAISPAGSPATSAFLRTLVYCIRGKGQGVRAAIRQLTVNGSVSGSMNTPRCPYLAGSAGFRLVTDGLLDPGERLVATALNFAGQSRAGLGFRIDGDETVTNRLFAYCVRR